MQPKTALSLAALAFGATLAAGPALAQNSRIILAANVYGAGDYPGGPGSGGPMPGIRYGGYPSYRHYGHYRPHGLYGYYRPHGHHGYYGHRY
jgi:hypothetical protein